MENEDIYKEAAKRVQAKKGFFQHLIAYLGVIGLLYAIMYFENGGEMLPVIIVAISWGIGLASHYFKAFGTEQLEVLGFNSDWEEDELEKEVDKLTRKRELKEQLLEERLLLKDLSRAEEQARLEDIDKLDLEAIEKKILYRDRD